MTPFFLSFAGSSVLSRLLAAVLGGYLLASALAVFLATVLSAPCAESVLAGMLWSFAVYVLAVFFGLWSLALLHALVRAPVVAWQEQLGLLAVLCLLLPLLNWITVVDSLPVQIARGDWERTGVDLCAMALGLPAAWAWRYLRRRSCDAARRAPAVKMEMGA